MVMNAASGLPEARSHETALKYVPNKNNRHRALRATRKVDERGLVPAFSKGLRSPTTSALSGSWKIEALKGKQGKR